MSAFTLLLLLFTLGIQARVQFLGVSIAGGDFGCAIDGTCTLGSAQLPLSSLGGSDGQSQMTHFVKDDGVNLFRLPISWQFLANSNTVGGTLDATNLGKYDKLVQACLSTGAHCMLDMHNFARVNGAIIGQGGPTTEQFADLWKQLATKYANESRIVFELMNEPHDLDVAAWATTCQAAVTAIRNAGATSQTILLPGTNFDSAATLVSSGSADALLAVTNPDGSTTGLLLDVHKYLDVDNSGTHSECVMDNVGNFSTVAEHLRARGRQGFVSETGASSQASCLTNFCAQNAFINSNADVFVGLVGWAAGGFATSYVLSMTPTKQGTSFVDTAIMTQCMVATFRNSTTTNQTTTVSASAGASTTTVRSTSTARSTSTSTSRSTSRNSTAVSLPATSSLLTTLPGAVFASTTAIGSSTMTVDVDAPDVTDTPTTLMIATGTPTPGTRLTTGSATVAAGRVNSTTTRAVNAPVQTAGATRGEQAAALTAVLPALAIALAFAL